MLEIRETLFKSTYVKRTPKLMFNQYRRFFPSFSSECIFFKMIFFSRIAESISKRELFFTLWFWLWICFMRSLYISEPIPKVKTYDKKWKYMIWKLQQENTNEKIKKYAVIGWTLACQCCHVTSVGINYFEHVVNWNKFLKEK